MWASGVKPSSGGDGGASWTERGNIVTPDFTAGDLTQDGTFYMLDISGIVGAAAKLVLIRSVLRHSSADKMLVLKTQGYANDKNASVNIGPIAGKNSYKDHWVYTNASGQIAYMVTAVSFTTIDLTIGGWF